MICPGFGLVICEKSCPDFGLSFGFHGVHPYQKNICSHLPPPSAVLKNKVGAVLKNKVGAVLKNKIVSVINSLKYIVKIKCELFFSCTGQNECVNCREFDRNIKFVSGMVSGGILARFG